MSLFSFLQGLWEQLKKMVSFNLYLSYKQLVFQLFSLLRFLA